MLSELHNCVERCPGRVIRMEQWHHPLFRAIQIVRLVLPMITSIETISVVQLKLRLDSTDSDVGVMESSGN